MKKILKWSGYGLLTILTVGFIWGYEADIELDTLKAKYATPPSQFIKVADLDVHYRREGTARLDSLPVVLIHGTGASLLTWNGWTDSLKNDYQVIRLDLPAYGLTGPNANHNYSLDYYADFLGQFLDKLGVKKCVLGGNSLGWAVAWTFALKYPARVGKLILIDAAGYPMQSKSVPITFQMARLPVVNQLFTKITPRAVVEGSIKNVYANPSKVTPELVDQYWDMAKRAGNRAAFMARMSAAKTPDSTWQQIKTLTMPTLIMWGAQDLLIPIGIARRFEADLPNDTLVVYNTLGHVPMEENPAETVKAVKSFLVKNNKT